VIDPDAPDGFDAVLLEESLEELYEQAPCGYVSTFPDGSFARANQTFLGWIGYARDELLRGKRFQDLLTIGGRIFYETHYAPLLQMQGFVNEIAFDLICRDGRHLPILISSIQKRNAAGTPLLHRTTIFNASDRREYERELLIARKQAEQAADRITHLLTITTMLSKALTPLQVAEIITQQSSRVLNAQAGVVGIVTSDGISLEIVHSVGYPTEMLESWRHFPLDTHMPLADAVRTGEPSLLASPSALAARYPQLAALVERTGNQSVVAIPLSSNGRAIGVLGLSFAIAQSFTTEDRTFLLMLARQCALALERARLYEAEQAAHAAAQEAVHIRDTFFSVAAHELKNPLTSLLGNAQLLQRRLLRESRLSEGNQRSLAVVIEQAVRLNKMITEMLDVGRIASGHLTINRARLDINALIQRVVAEAQPTLIQHTLSYHDPGTPLIINGDASRLEQVLQNLLQNAIKYSPAGGRITLRVERQGQVICIAVADQGIGIPQRALPQLFQRFYRATQAAAGGIEGLGIGLYVVKEIVTLHGGTVMVESTEGVGSTFTVCLPLAH
jgi:PAS domain S-box-containing protein